MKTVCRSLAATLAVALLSCAVAVAQQPARPPQPPPDDFLARELFPPELIMQHQQDIALRPEQRTAITKAIQDLQTKVIDLQWRMQDQSQRLAAMLDKPTVDQAAALAQADAVLDVERELKRAHLALLIQIKNTLTAEQQAKLAAARAATMR